MPLDPQIRLMRDRRAQDGAAQLYTLSLEEARAADLASIRAVGGDPEPVHEVTDRLLPGPGGDLPIRIYRPSAERPLPALLYFFGGGWTLGSVDTSDGICRSLANAADCVVFTVGYRLAPEHRFPAAIEDCHAALRWVAQHAEELGVDPTRLAVGGDSAGGNLAAAVTLLARADSDSARSNPDGDTDSIPSLAGQLLVYPNTDQLADSGSMRENVDPWLFNRDSVAWYRQFYLTTPQDAVNPLASPLLAKDLSGLPPALVITAEYDPLRDQGEQYARRLAADGVHVELSRYPGMVHGFFAMAGTVDAGRAAINQAARHLRSWFALPSA
jgi:acetyl esterase